MLGHDRRVAVDQPDAATSQPVLKGNPHVAWLTAQLIVELQEHRAVGHVLHVLKWLILKC